jgi:predicted nucleotidyltransferase
MTTMASRLPIDRQALSLYCRRHHVRRLALFGSVLRDDFRPDSDVDVLVEFDPAHVPGFIALSAMEAELSSLFAGHPVDLVTERFLNRRMRQRVLDRAEVQYAEG